MAQNPNSESELELASRIREGWASRIGALVDSELRTAAARILSVHPDLSMEEFRRHAESAFLDIKHWPQDHPFKV